MFPIIHIFWIQIYTFWISLTIGFFLFLWMLKRMSSRLGYDFSLYVNNLLWFFISTFFFSRLFFIISKWNDLKYIKSLKEFVIMTEYHFSLVWAIVWFLLVLAILLKIRKENFNAYIYGFMLSLLFVLPIWFIWALLWWQVYGIPDTNLWIEITYTSQQLTPVPYKTPIFPLPIVYAILFFATFCLFYIANMYVKHKSLLWYLSLMVFSLIIFIFEFFSWKRGVFQDLIWLNLSQITVLALLIFWVYKIYKIYTKNITL